LLYGRNCRGLKEAGETLAPSPSQTTACEVFDFGTVGEKTGRQALEASAGARSEPAGAEQAFKSPEEIRKANLRGADLRGARLYKVDFYLVDLRDARFDPEVERHLRRCGAILESRR
jgi:uncharacterized protein YjbI with pentapeptide repeats